MRFLFSENKEFLNLTEQKLPNQDKRDKKYFLRRTTFLQELKE